MAIILLLPFNNLFSQRLILDYDNSKKVNFYDIQKQAYQIWEEEGEGQIRGFKQFKRWEYFWFQRTYPTGEFPNSYEIYQESESIKKANKDRLSLQNTKWSKLGPINQPASEDGHVGIGRVNAVRFNPNNSNEIWAGSASGGLWRTTDYGSSWHTFPFTQFLSIGVSDIGIAHSNPKIVYVSTGDMFGSTSSRNFYSIGLIKTSDGGNNWHTTNLNSKLEDKMILGRVLVDPVNPDLVYVASNTGIFKSTDGGDTWKNSVRHLHVMDMEFKPGSSSTIYASTYSSSGNASVWVSDDAGVSWERTLLIPNAIRIAIGVSAADSERLYAIAANTGTYGFNSLQMSSDAGKNWEVRSNPTSLSRNILGWYTGNLSSDNSGQGFYDLCISVNPLNAEELFVGGINIWRSIDGGVNFVKTTHWTPSQQLPFVHADHHDLMYAPDNRTLFVGNDGGIDASSDNGTNWVSFSNGLEIMQFYKIGVSQKENGVVIGGAQDNGSSLRKNGSWKKVLSSDGMECIIDYNNPQIMYASIYNGRISRSTNGGESFNNIISSNTTNESGGWVTPYILNPVNSASIYVGYRNIWKSENYGARNSWKKISDINPSSTLQAIAIAPSDTNVIYAASVNQLFATYNGGEDWDIIHTSTTFITDIAVDPYQADRLWVSKSGFNSNDKVLEIIGSEVVNNLSYNIPNVPVNSIIIQENSPDRLYIGTDIGVFYTDYNSFYWEKLGSELPNVIIMELEIHKNSNTLYAATYGRGVWTHPLILCTADKPEIEVIKPASFCPGDTVIIRASKDYSNYRWSNGSTEKEIIVTKSGAYSLFVENGDGCIGRSNAFVIPKSPYDEIQITMAEQAYLCPDAEMVLYASSGFSQYIWSNGEEGSILKVREPGMYNVTGITEDGCTVTSEDMFVEMMPAPEKPTIKQEGNKLIASYGESYQWYHNDRRLFNETNRELIIKDGRLGDYTVLVSNEYTCTTMSDPFNVVTNVDDRIFNDFDISVSNNPGHGKFTLNFSNPVLESLDISITDLNGKTVFNTTERFESSYSYIVDLGHLPSGTYITRIKANDFVKIVKLIKI